MDTIFCNNSKMEREIKIEIPEGYEIDKEKSSFEKIVLKKVKNKVTIQDIERNIKDKKYYFTDACAINNSPIATYDPILLPSKTKEQLESIICLNQLCNVASFLNEDWNPTCNDVIKNANKYYFLIENSRLIIDFHQTNNGGSVFFKSKELAEEALRILGEETIIKALTLNH